MAKVQTLDWGAFMCGEIKEKAPMLARMNKALMALGGTAFALSFVHGIAFADPAAAVPAMGIDPSFQQAISTATKPIKDIIFGFAHEIYFVFMSWGAIEALIGKPQQGFSRMKISTGAYVLLFWVPWIVDQVNKARPHMGY